MLYQARNLFAAEGSSRSSGGPPPPLKGRLPSLQSEKLDAQELHELVNGIVTGRSSGGWRPLAAKMSMIYRHPQAAQESTKVQQGPFSGLSLSLLERCLLSAAPAEIIRRLVQLPKALLPEERTIPIIFENNESLVIQGSYAHIAMAEPNLRVLHVLREFGVNFSTKNSRGELPIEIFVRLHPSRNSEVFEWLLQEADKKPRGLSQEVFTSLIQQSSPSRMQIIGRHLAAFAISTKSFPRYSDDETSAQEGKITLAEIFIEIEKGMCVLERDGYLESKIAPRAAWHELRKRTGDPYLLYLYIEAMREAMQGLPNTGVQASWKNTLHFLIRSWQHDSLHPESQTPHNSIWNAGSILLALLKRNEHTHDMGEWMSRLDPKLSCYLLALSHPSMYTSTAGYREFDGQCMSAATEVITATHQWVGSKAFNYDDRVPGPVLSQWKEVGRLAFSFANLRMDTIQIPRRKGGSPQSLVEAYGFRASNFSCPEGRKHFGSGYEFQIYAAGRKEFSFKHFRTQERRTLSSKTKLFTCRGFDFVTHPRGCLLARNSSDTFGWNILKSPAYWSLDPIDVSTVRNWKCGSEIEYHMTSLFDPFLNGGYRDPERHDERSLYLQDSVDFLLGEMCGILGHYERWKCDTDKDTAFQDTAWGERALVGGHKTEGFHFALEKHEDSWAAFEDGHIPYEALYDFAFRKFDGMIWEPIGFEFNNKMYYRLETNALVLKHLRKLVDRDLLGDSPEEQKIFQFFQTGFRHQGSLVFLPKKELQE